MDLPQWLHIIIRSSLLVIILFLIMKWLGKKQLSQLTFFEYIVGITIGSIAAEISTGLERSFLHGLYSMLVWSIIPFVAGLIALKNKKARDFIEGQSTVVIKDGKVQEDHLIKEKYSSEELLQLLRNKNVFNVADVEFAVLEENGDLNVLLKKEKRPVTVEDLQLDVAPEKVPQTVILDGQIMDNALNASGYTRSWLEVELQKLNVALDNVFIGQIDSYGKLHVDIYDDQMKVPNPQERPLLLSALKKCQADFEAFSLQTDCEQTKKMYQTYATSMKEIIDRTAHLLT